MLPVNGQIKRNSLEEQRVSRLTMRKVHLVEESDLSIVEKINVLALLCGYKQITDLAIDRDSTAAVKILTKINLPFVENFYIDPQGVRHEWLQVAGSRAILNYIVDRRNQLTVLEAGVLYGYPFTACLAYIGMLEKTWFKKTVAEYYLSGVFSQPYLALERAHFKQIWEAIAKTSPPVIAQAELEYSLRKIELDAFPL